MNEEVKFRYENGVLYNGDCIEAMKTIPNDSIDLIVTDPPYKVTSRGRGKRGTTTSGGMLEKESVCKGKIFKHNDVELESYIPEFYRILKEGSHFYIMTNHINLTRTLNICQENGFHFIKSLIWNKENKIMSQLYMSQFEYILFFRKGSAKKINNCGTSDILNVPNKKTKGLDGENIHDTEKPIELMRILIENSSEIGDYILDPFMGVGSTGMACAIANRKFIGMEIDEIYFNIAKERISNAPVIN